LLNLIGEDSHIVFCVIWSRTSTDRCSCSDYQGTFRNKIKA